MQRQQNRLCIDGDRNGDQSVQVCLPVACASAFKGPLAGCVPTPESSGRIVRMSDSVQPAVDLPASAYDESGVDLTLIRWMLSLTPIERIEHIQQLADSIAEIRELNGIAEPR